MFTNKITRILNTLRLNNKELVLENLNEFDREYLIESGYSIMVLNSNKYLILEN